MFSMRSKILILVFIFTGLLGFGFLGEHVGKPSFVAKFQNFERDTPAENEAYQAIRRVRAVGSRSRNSGIAAEYGVFRYALAQERRIAQEIDVEGFFTAREKFDKVDRNKNKISDGLEELIKSAAAGNRFDAIILLEDSLDVLPTLKNRHGNFDEKFTYSAINGFAASITKEQIIAFSKDANIKRVEFDALVYPHLDTSQEWFGTAKARTDFSVDGNADGLASYSKDDVVIAILDTGIDPNHVDLDGGKIIAWRDSTINNDQSGPYDELGNCSGHGTHVSSIAAGEGDGDATLKGVAPKAALVGVKVLSLRRIRGAGGGLFCTAATSEIVAGVQWIIDNKATYGIDVANMSIGSAGCSDGTDSLSSIVNSATDAGIVMVTSAGNEGPGTCTIGAPAAAEKAITVGAMADVLPDSSGGSFGCGIAPYRGFYLICFSSRGLTADSRLKPDIASPGVFINAASAGTVNGYKVFSGTSMASPFTAGVAALMLHANSSLTPAQIKSKIESTGVDWGLAGKDIEYGSGRLQGYEAVKSAGGFSGTNVSTPGHIFLSGTVTAGGFSDHIIEVTDATLPLAATMVISSWSGGSPDLDLEVRDDAGNPLFVCSGPSNSTSPCPCTNDASGTCKSRTVSRQETIGFEPLAAGTYTLRADSFSGGGDYFIDVSLGQTAVAISLTTDGATAFGIVVPGGMVDTTISGTNDVQTITVDTGPADISVRSTNFSDGSNTWTLGATNGADQVKWEFSEDGITWTTFSSANTLFTLDTNVAEGQSRSMYLRLTTPTSSSSGNEHAATVTFVASAP